MFQIFKGLLLSIPCVMEANDRCINHCYQRYSTLRAVTLRVEPCHRSSTIKVEKFNYIRIILMGTRLYFLICLNVLRNKTLKAFVTPNRTGENLVCVECLKALESPKDSDESTFQSCGMCGMPICSDQCQVAFYTFNS